MPFYTKLGEIPKKRHTRFRRPDGKFYSEEVVGTEGFVPPEGPGPGRVLRAPRLLSRGAGRARDRRPPSWPCTSA